MSKTGLAKRNRKLSWRQCSLWSLMALVALTSVLLAVWDGYRRPYLRQRAAVAKMRTLAKRLSVKTTPAGPAWLRSFYPQGEIEDVTEFEIRDDETIDRALANLHDLPHLRTLKITSSYLSDAGMQHLVTLTELEKLEILCSDRVTDDGFCQVAHLKHLDFFSFWGSGVTGKGLRCLRHLPRLGVLDLAYLETGDECLVEISHLNTLWLLSIHNMPVSDAGLRHLRQRKQLEDLYFGDTKVTAEGVDELRRFLPDAVIRRYQHPSTEQR